jgi:hypothetical protein
MAMRVVGKEEGNGNRQQDCQQSHSCGISLLLDSPLANIQQFLLKVCQTRFPRNSFCSGNSRKIPFAPDLDLTPNLPGIPPCVWCTAEWHHTNTKRKSCLLVWMMQSHAMSNFFLFSACHLQDNDRNKHAKCKLVWLVEDNHFSSYFHQHNSPSICTVISDPTLSEQHYDVANSFPSSYNCCRYCSCHKPKHNPFISWRRNNCRHCRRRRRKREYYHRVSQRYTLYCHGPQHWRGKTTCHVPSSWSGRQTAELGLQCQFATHHPIKLKLQCQFGWRVWCHPPGRHQYYHPIKLELQCRFD